MKKFIQHIILLVLVLINCNTHANTSIDSLVKHTVVQLNKLYLENTYNDDHGKHDDNWYIYVLGGTIEDLKFIKAESDSTFIKNESNKTFTSGYLTQLNELLKKVNQGNKADIYVAFTDYTSELITPIFPPEYNTLSLQELYINKLLENSSDKDHVVQLFRDYKALFNNTLKRIYDESLLANSKKENIFMPFVSFENRTIFNSEIKEISNIPKRYKTYTLYSPKRTDFKIGEYKKRYEGISSVYGKTGAEIKMERVVRALNSYYYGEDVVYKECEDLLKKEEFQVYLNQDEIWREVIKNNPCILYHIQKLHGDYIGDTEFAKELRMIVNRTLLGAMATPVMAIVGEYALYETLTFLVEKYGAQKVRQVSQAAITNIVLQAVMNYYFDENSRDIDTTIRWRKSLENIDKGKLTKEVFVAACDINMRGDLVLECITGGLKFNEKEWYDISEYDFDINSCIRDVAIQLVAGGVLKTGGILFDKLYQVAKNNPKMFIKGYREILNDTGEEGVKAFREYLTDIEKAFDINDKSLIGIKLDVEAKYVSDVKQFYPDRSFASLTKDVISDIEFDKVNLNSGVTKVGVNTELNFPNHNGNIRPTILTQLSDGSYKMVFVVNKNITINSLEDFIKNTNITGNRKEILNTFLPNTKAILKGNNAQKYFGKQNVEINIKDVEIYTVDANGNPVINNVEMGVKGAGNWLTQRSSFWDDWINKCFPGKNWGATTFLTKGKNYNTFKTTNASIYNDMKALNPNEIKLQEFIEAGSTIPVKVSINNGDEFFKIVPKGNNIGSPSAYYVDQAQLNLIKANPEKLEQVLGLPLGSVNAEYDVFKITYKGINGYVFKSTVAATEQFANSTPNVKYLTQGGGTQTLILDNMDETKWLKGSAPIESIIPNKLPLIGN